MSVPVKRENFQSPRESQFDRQVGPYKSLLNLSLFLMIIGLAGAITGCCLLGFDVISDGSVIFAFSSTSFFIGLIVGICSMSQIENLSYAALYEREREKEDSTLCHHP